MTVVCSASITMIDMNDITSSSTAPSNPIEGFLWMDTSMTPPVLKVWKDGKWEISADEAVGTTNLLKNTGLRKDTADWTLPSGITRDTTQKKGSNNSFKYQVTGLTVSEWRSTQPTRVAVDEYNRYSVACEIYIPTNHGIDQGLALEVQWFDADGTRIDTDTASPDLTLKDRWQRVKIERLRVPTGAVTANARVWVGRNGTFYVAEMIMAEGPKIGSWVSNPDDIKNETNDAVDDAIKGQTQEEILNKLTNNGQSQGIFIDEDKNFYFEGEYFRGENLNIVRHSDRQSTFKVDSTGEVEINARKLSIGGTSVATTVTVENAINGIEVGARNFLQQTSKEFKTVTMENWNYALGDFSLTTLGLKVGDNLAFRLYLKFGEVFCGGSARFTFYNASGGNIFTIKGNNIHKNSEGFSQVLTTIPEGAVRVWIGIQKETAGEATPNVELKYHSPKFEKGTICTDWTPAIEDMENAYTILLSNEVQVFPTNVNRVPMIGKAYSTDVVVYKGTSQRTDFTIGKVNSANGITVTQTASRVSFSVGTATALEADDGLFTIPITIDGKTFNKVFSWSCAKQGSQGPQGSQGITGVQGPQGEAAKYVILSGDQVFKYAANFTGTPTPATIKISLAEYGFTGSTTKVWQYKQGSGAWQTLSATSSSTTSYNVDPSNSALWGSGQSITIKCTIGDRSDEITLVKVADGGKGTDGKGVKSIQEQYYLSTSMTALAGGSWVTTAPAASRGKYIWTRSIITYTDNSTTTTPEICVSGSDGVTGNTGASGVSITKVDVEYGQSSSSTTVPTSWTTTAPAWANGKYIWSRTKTTYSDGNSSITNPACITGQQGITGTTGTSITSVDVEYYLSTSATSLAGGSWATTAPTWTSGKFMWSRTKTVYSTGSSSYSQPACLTGQQGQTGNTGNTGAAGTGISSITEEYYLSTSKTSQAGGEWVTTPPTWKANHYLWTRSKIIYSNPTSTVYTTPVCDNSWEAINEIAFGGTNLAIGTNNGNDNWHWSMQTNAGRTITSEIIDGVDSVKFVKDSTSASGWAYLGYEKFARTKITPNTEYVVSFEVKSSTTSVIDNVDLMKGDATGTLLKSKKVIQGVVPANSNTWTKVVASLTTKDVLPTTTGQIVYIGGLNTNAGSTHFVRNFQLECGNKPTAWSPAPEDISTNIDEVKSSLNTFEDTVNGTFKDGLIEQAEAKAIRQQLNSLETVRMDTIRDYNTVYANSFLTGTAKTNLASAKANFENAHDSLISTINTVIADGRVNATESASVTSTFVTYNSVVGTYRERLQEALDSISTAKIDNIQIGGRNILLNSSFQKDVDKWYDSSVTQFTTIDGKKCANIKHTAPQTTKVVGQSLMGKLEPNTKYTISGWVRTDNIVKGATNFTIMFYHDGWYLNNGVSTWYGYGSKPFTINTGTGKWEYLTWTFTADDTNFQNATNSMMYVYTRDFIGDVYFYNLKLEKGTKATDWIEASEDVQEQINNTVASVDVMYYLSTSSTSLAGGAWSTTAPTWVDGKFMWSKTVTTLKGGSSKESSPTCIAGAQGSSGKGIVSVVEQYYHSTSMTTLAGGSWGPNPPTPASGKYIWTRSIIAYTDNTNTTTSPICTTGSTGATGNTGATGPTGPTGATGQDAITIVLSNETHSFPCENNGNIPAALTATCNIIAYKGATRVNASVGAITNPSGMTISASNNGTVNPSLTITASVGTSLADTGSVNIPITVDGKVITKSFSWSKAKKGATGSTGSTGAAGTSIKSVDVEYYLSTSSSSLAGGSWVTTAPAWVNGRFMWSRTKTTYSTGSSSYSNPACITGQQGNTGGTGATGTGVSSITEEYYLSTSKTSQTGGTWAANPPTWIANSYLWTRSKIVYTNPSSTAYTTPLCDSSWEAVNEIQIGGRNLASKKLIGQHGETAVTVTGYVYSWSANSNFNGLKLAPSMFEVGKRYVLTYKAKKVSGTITRFGGHCSSTDVRVYIDDVYVSNSYANGFDYPQDTNSHTIRVEFLAPASTEGDRNVYIQPNRSGVSSQYSIEVTDIQVEHGNIATAWTPAIEDVQEEINDTVAKVDVMYYLSTSQTSLAGGSWSTTAPTWVNGKYMWSKTVTTLKGGTSKESPPTCIAGATGATGSSGKGITSIVEQYYHSTSMTSMTGGSWSTSAPTPASGKYIWTRSVVTYTDNSTTTTTGICTTGATGNTGSTGSKGEVGEAAKTVDILASSQVFKSTDGGKTFSPSTITLTPTLQNVSYSNWQYSINGGSSWATVTNGQNGLTISGNVLTISKDSALYTSSVTSLVFRVNTNVSNTYDTMTIVKLYDVAELSQQDVFNKLTNNGQNQGLFMENNKLWLNMEYAKAKTITADKLAIGDFTNYAMLNDDITSQYGFTRESGEAKGSWLRINSMKRDVPISEFYECNGGETFRLKGDISTTVKGNTSSGGTNSEFVGTALSLFTYDGNGSSIDWQHSDRVKNATQSVSSTITLPANARKFRVFIQTESYGNWSGTLKVRNIQVTKMSNAELIVNGSITADKLATNAITANIITSGTFKGVNFEAGGSGKAGSISLLGENNSVLFQADKTGGVYAKNIEFASTPDYNFRDYAVYNIDGNGFKGVSKFEDHGTLNEWSKKVEITNEYLKLETTGMYVPGGNQGTTLIRPNAITTTGSITANNVTATGSITAGTESRFSHGAYVDPWSGTSCAIKATGNIASTGIIRGNSFQQINYSQPIEIGRYIDMHQVGSSTDVDVRLIANGRESLLIARGDDLSRYVGIGTGPNDRYIYNNNSNKYFTLKDDGRLAYDGWTVPHNWQQSFTPFIYSDSGRFSMVEAWGEAVYLGDLVYIRGRVRGSRGGHYGTVNIGGLPVGCIGPYPSLNFAFFGGVTNNLGNDAWDFKGYIEGGGASHVILNYTNKSTGGWQTIQCSHLTTGNIDIAFSATYRWR